MPSFQITPPSIANLGPGLFLGGSQSFRTIPVANTQLALYTLVIRSPGGYGLVAGYTFPISPANIRKEFNDLTNFYDVAGNPYMLGVNRIVDIYGQSPVTYTIEGTTGWKLHSSDGFGLTGLQSIQALESTIAQFVELNQTIISGGQQSNLYTLEFYDYFRNDYWQVVPCGPQMIRQSRARPLFVDYMFRLVGVQDLSSPIALFDPLASLFTELPATAGLNMITAGLGIATSYAASTFNL